MANIGLSMPSDATLRERLIRDHQEWLGFLQPDGLVVSPSALVDADVALRTRVIEIQQRFAPFTQMLEQEDAETTAVADLAALCRDFLEWPNEGLFGLEDARPLPDALTVPLPEFGEILAPTFALRDVRAKPDAEQPWLLLVKALPTGTDLDAATTGAEAQWTASATRRFERLLRETRVPIGLLCNGTHLRLIYAPRGENTGSLTFPVGAMTKVSGRPILAAFVELLSRERLFVGPSEARLPALLRKSRDYQASVSTALAEQVLEALYELLRGFQAADEHTQGRLLGEVLKNAPNQVYQGLLTVLMRLVFTLYAEDRGVMPGSSLYQQNYAVHGLFERLRADDEHYPDTMDHRYGAWAQLLALFRAVHGGCAHRLMAMPTREGYLFDPDRFPFIEGRPAGAGEPASLPLVADGVIFRVLRKLLILDGERLSYRTLDVEQIGSVYEAIMGFSLRPADGPTIALKQKKTHGAPVPINLDALLCQPGDQRAKWLADDADVDLPPAVATALAAARTLDEVMAALEKRIARGATPAVVQQGAMLLVPSDERRRSGSHYTPRSLTEPIVRKALEPILADLGDKPLPGQILDLKVCDPAMGSGAFLVEACRQLADALVAGWQRTGSTPKIPPDEDELLFARRLIAQRCLYGVDKNPMAVDLAKLSLWLATLARDHAFTFLDHSFKAGDSLVGLSRKQIAAFHWNVSDQRFFKQQFIENRIEEALAFRALILDAGDSQTPEVKRAALAKADAKLDDARLVGDLLIAAFWSADTARKREDARRAMIEPLTTYLALGAPALRPDAPARALRTREQPVTPLHWEIEFPEVFDHDNGGFDAFVGNPPFLGGKKISGANGDEYLAWLNTSWGHARGHADLCAFFFLRSFDLLRNGGTFGMIATNTIAQGDTRVRGLDHLTTLQASIYNAVNSMEWPGVAAVFVSVVHVYKGIYSGVRILGYEPVVHISAMLDSTRSLGTPHRLAINANKGFTGTYVLGLGFVLAPEDAQALIEKDVRNKDVLFPYLSGEDLNSRPDQSPSRWVINFFDWPEDQAREYADCFEVVERLVKPERTRRDELGIYKLRNPLPQRWWIYGEKRPALYLTIAQLKRVLVVAQTSRTCAPAFSPTGIVFSHKVVVFGFTTFRDYSVVQSIFHDLWARKYSSTLKDDLSYTPSTAFETFPFPRGTVPDDGVLNLLGESYHEHRRSTMLSRQEGLTKVYNRFHDKRESSGDISRLRALHLEMDVAVAAAYGWTDLALDHGFHESPQGMRYTISEPARREILARLLQLNFERAEDERLTGLAASGADKPKVKGARGRKPRSMDNSMSLPLAGLDDPNASD